jgi:hypothetical protein
VGEPEFQKFVEILQSGDAEAVDRLLSDFDPFLRRAIRRRLFDGRARRIADTGDILQSLLKDFLAREQTEEAAMSARKLRAYLAAAAQYKISKKIRKERRRTADLEAVSEPASPEPMPCKEVEDRDFLETMRSRLDDNNRRLFDLSRQGRTWRQIADEIGGHPDSLRIQLRRSVASILSEIRNRDSTHAG